MLCDCLQVGARFYAYDDVIERIEIGHITKKSKPGKVIRIYWKLK